MLLSMTGYGKASGHYKGKELRVELKSLNSKSLNLHLHLPDHYREKEIQLRNLLRQQLQRGRINLRVTVQFTGETMPATINEKLAKSYYKRLSKLADELKAETSDIFRLALQMPEVIAQEQEEMEDEEWQLLQKLVEEAIEGVIAFRKKEGQTIADDLQAHLNAITSGLESINKNVPKRKEAIREKLENGLEVFLDKTDIDTNRLEQELVYYIEKLDIAEECQRLNAHIEHFTSTLKESGQVGKKLDFIAQEMGREINTMGAKANDSTIQAQVVHMKDRQSKIREQVMNVF